MDISVIIPVFNEEKSIISTVAEVEAYLKNNFSEFEIIVVDDASSDHTLDVLAELPVRVLRNLKNKGKGYTVAKGVRAAKGDLILFMDADNSTRIFELEKFLPQLDRHHLIIASRALKDSKIELSQNPLKVFLGRSGNMMSRILIDWKVLDTQCGFKLFTRDFQPLFEKLTIDRFAFDFELIYLAKKHGFLVKEMPITWRNDFNSSVRWYDYPRTMLNLFKIRFNDLFKKYN